MFFGRQDELNKLNKRYASDAFECVIIYGRRRVGKTALINEFCQNKPTIFFSALNSTAEENLVALSKAIYTFKEPSATAAPIYPDFEAAFAALAALGQNQRPVFVIDEYPYLAKAAPDISSRLQHLIDHKWSTGKLFVILCGSSMSFMEKQVLGYESPLYGRRTAQLKIEPLLYREAANFYPNLAPAEQALVYGITGGVPHYLNKLDVRANLDVAILQNIFDRSAYLFEEPQNLLKQELREPAVYNAIITAIAGGASRLNDIAQKAGLDTSACTKYLSVLGELGIILKETPVTEKLGRKTVYQIADSFFNFWYRFVPGNMASIVSGRIAANYEQTIKPFYAAFMGLVFERLCRDYLLYYAPNLPIALQDIGQWWGTDKTRRTEVQIDIVASGIAAEEYIIGSCKYKNEKIGVDELALLQQYAQVFGKGTRYHYYIFSKSGFTANLKAMAAKGEVKLVNLEDMYRN